MRDNFNSHAHVERDHNDLVKLTGYSDFNSHAHVERDKIHYLFINGIWYFNSHAHVERDPAEMNSFFAMIISTHTLTWSVTAFTPIEL